MPNRSNPNAASPRQPIAVLGRSGLLRPTLLAATLLATAPAMAAGSLTCSGLKQTISASGQYLYHYRNASKPELDLYERYVRSDLQCDADASLVLKPVPLLADCDVPTCVKQGGNASR